MQAHMKKYDCMIDEIHQMLMEATEYGRHAAKYKTEDRPLSEVYYEMARQELSNASNMKEHVSRMVMGSGHDMLPVLWERDHERIVRWMASAKSALEMYKN